MSTDDNATPRSGGANDSAKAADTFGVTQSIPPNSPSKRRPSGAVEFPSGVTLMADGDIHVRGFGTLTEGVATQISASLAGAVIERGRQRDQDARRRAGAPHQVR